MSTSLSKTPAPKKDKIYGSKVNPKGSASSEKSAKSIKLSGDIIVALTNKLKEFKEKHPNSKNIGIADLKAVYRRGSGAYSTSHRPNITRNGWAMARVNKFLLKVGGTKVKAAYVQDDDLMAKGGDVGQGIKCRRCGWQWNTNQSEKFDKYVCHNCGFDNTSYYDKDVLAFNGGGALKSFYEWYIDWYKRIKNEITITISLPNELQPFKENNVVIINKFKKEREDIKAYNYLQQMLNKSDEFGITIYLEPTPIGNVKTKSELIDYYKKFGFESTPNKEFMKRLPRYKDGGEVDDHKETYAKWKLLVNMSKSELEKFYNSEEGKVAGLKPSEAKAQGIDSGRESARWVMKMKDTPVSEWTPQMWKWAKKQISFISRMSGNKGGLYDDKGRKTRKHLSLLIWGNNPEKKNNGGMMDIRMEDTVGRIDDPRLIDISYYEGGGEIPNEIIDLLKESKSLQIKMNDSSAKLNEIANREERPMGLVSDKIKQTDEFKKAKSDYNRAFQDYRNFNSSAKGKQLIKYLSKLDRMQRMKIMKQNYAKGGVIDNELQDLLDEYRFKLYKKEKNVFVWVKSLKHDDAFLIINFNNNIYALENKEGKYSINELKRLFKSERLKQKSYSNGGTINKNINFMEQNKFASLPHIDTINNGDKVILHEQVFGGDLEQPRHIGSRYIVCEVMGRGGMTNSLNLKVAKSIGTNAINVGSTITRPISVVLAKGKKYVIEPIANKVSSFKDGGELNPDNKQVKQFFAHDSGNAGGVLVGKRHSEGGIKAINKSTGQPIEMEGGEVVITRGAVSNPKKYSFNGKDMTTREILSNLNVDGGGVSFAEGGDVPDKINCGCSHMDLGGTTMTPQDFIRMSEKEYEENRLIGGIEKERNDHFYTLAKLNAGAITIEQALKEIAIKEMMLDAKYPFGE